MRYSRPKYWRYYFQLLRTFRSVHRFHHPTPHCFLLFLLLGCMIAGTAMHALQHPARTCHCVARRHNIPCAQGSDLILLEMSSLFSMASLYLSLFQLKSISIYLIFLSPKKKKEKDRKFLFFFTWNVDIQKYLSFGCRDRLHYRKSQKRKIVRLKASDGATAARCLQKAMTSWYRAWYGQSTAQFRNETQHSTPQGSGAVR